MKKTDEYENFDRALRQVLSVSHEELKRREEQWKKERKAKKRKKSKKSSASREGA